MGWPTDDDPLVKAVTQPETVSKVLTAVEEARLAESMEAVPSMASSSQ